MKERDIIHLYTSEGERLRDGGENPYHTAYPRPQLERDSFFSLNGEWELSVNGGISERIEVPFPPESLLSGICRSMGKRAVLKYKKYFRIPEGFKKERIILHFGAVDQIAEVMLNGASVTTHEGGYLPFEADVTALLAEGENLLEVNVTDDLSDKSYPYGKQRYDRGGMWYTPVSGIWQSVWMESVPARYVKALRITPSLEGAVIEAEGISDGEITVFVDGEEEKVALANGKATVNPRNIRLWSPEDPYLYRFELRSGEDTVRSYFALRTVETRRVDGIPRICLNGKPVFLHALLDQGYYSDGIYTPASPKCYEDDILFAKSMGFNTLRKHIKVEPELFYYYCDLHGLIVMQDMVNNGSYSFIRDTALPTVFMKSFPDKLMNRDKTVRERYIKNAKDTVKTLYNHPCICYYTIFNEGWGQFDADNVYGIIKPLDTTRVYDTASGWFHPKQSDVESVHKYFKPYKFKKGMSLPTVLSEFGGYSLKLAENSANTHKTYGYKRFETEKELENALVALYENEIIPVIGEGLCGAVLTQISDVEDEVNGLITYDRKRVKVSQERMLELAEKMRLTR